MLDRVATIQRSRPVSVGGPEVDALLFTAITPWTGKVMFNTETGDYGSLAERNCGCSMGTLGLRAHLWDLRSFEKLTGEGVTFVRTNVEQILEQVLPARFGGTATEYQLAEEEGPNGTTRLVLGVAPDVGPVDEAALRETFLDELGRGSISRQYQAGFWRDAGTLEVRREAPLVTGKGKVLPLHLLQRADVV
jgi:hypothetical protein